MRDPSGLQIRQVTVEGFEGRMGMPKRVFGGQRAAESEAKGRPSFENAGVTLNHLAQPSNHPNLNHNCLVA